MNRKARRAQPKELQKINNDINSLTPMQAKIANMAADERANTIAKDYIHKFEVLLDRNMSAALIDYGIDYEDIEGIQNNMSEMLDEDTQKSFKLGGGNINMKELESKVLEEVKILLKNEVSKKESVEKLIYKFPKLSRSMLINAYVKVKKEMGLVENRISKETVYAEFDRNAVKLSGAAMVSNVMKKFKFTESTAKTYYSKWKKEYMMGKIVIDPVIPDAPIFETKPTIETANLQELEINAKKIIEAAKEIQCVKPVKEEEMEVAKVKGTLKILESNVVVRKTVKLLGENGGYVADTVSGVTLTKDDMLIYFENEEQLNEWVEEFKAVFAMVVR